MNPHNFQNYQPSPPQFRNNLTPTYQFHVQQPHSPMTLNLPQNNFHHQGAFSPTDNHLLNQNKIDRVMYSSSIQNTIPNKTFTIGKLQTMGRFVPNSQQTQNQNNKMFHQLGPHPSHQYPKNVWEKQSSKQYQFGSSNSKINEFQRFPEFNLQHDSLTQRNFPVNNFQNQSMQQQEKQQMGNQILSPQEKRRRQILAIKQQLDLINKKMENSKLNKNYTAQLSKNDSRPQQYIPTSNQFSNSTTYTENQNISETVKNQILPQNVGLSFTRNVNQLQPGERNKGMVAQSMIVSTEPSPGYKYQSIFDKYDSLKKPVYETTNFSEKKDQKPSLLDNFVNKGPLSFSAKQKTEQNFLKFNNVSYSTANSQQKTSTPVESGNHSYSRTNQGPIGSLFPKSQPISFSPSQKSTPISAHSNSPSIEAKTHFEPSKEEATMFKKKKANFQEQIKIENIIADTLGHQNDGQEGKNSKGIYGQNIVTKTMNQLKIQESTEFKREDFVVGKKLGKGQFGEVMLVQHKKTGFLCGMKVMEKKQIRDEKYEGQIARQLSIQLYLAHRNIAPLYGYFQDEKNVYLLVEYCIGGQLLQMLRKNRRMEEPEVSRVIRQIIEGIDYIHKELIIHRDIKPENILFNFGVAKICDFGWAVYKGHGMRKTASVGSPLYYSPEIVMGVQYDEKIDIWDIGMMTYQCLLGKIPFRIYSELDLNRIVEDEIKFPEYIDTSEEAKDFILRIMKKKPEERMEIRDMLRHPFITKYNDSKIGIDIMKDLKEILN